MNKCVFAFGNGRKERKRNTYSNKKPAKCWMEILVRTSFSLKISQSKSLFSCDMKRVGHKIFTAVTKKYKNIFSIFN